MKQLVFDGKNGPIVEDCLLNKLNENQVLIETTYSLISPGTECHYIDQCKKTGQRLRPGYCVVGTIRELGTNVNTLIVGQKVIAMGWEYACHAEYVHVPYKLVVPIPDGMDLQAALLANLLATAVHACDRADLKQNDKVLIIGAGLVGRLVAAYSKSITQDITVTDQQNIRLDILDEFKTVTCNELLSENSVHTQTFSKAFICINGDATDWMKTLPRLLRYRGNEAQRPRIIGVGRFTANMNFSVEMGNIDILFAARCGEGYRNDEHVHGIVSQQSLPGESTVEVNLLRALTAIHERRVNVHNLISKTTSFADATKIYGALKNMPECMGVMINYRDS